MDVSYNEYCTALDLNGPALDDIRARFNRATSEPDPTKWPQFNAADISLLLALLDLRIKGDIKYVLGSVFRDVEDRTQLKEPR